MVSKIQQPTKYKRCIIAPAPGASGYDVFDGTGRWFNTPTQRRAKWWASIHDRLESQFKAAPWPAPEAT